MQIVMLPFAGGNKNSYQPFTRAVPGIHSIEYPGRGSRMREPLAASLDLLVDDVIFQIRNLIDINKKFIIYGHSMGAIVGFVICHKLKEMGLPQPVKLIVSGRKAPQLPKNTFYADLPENEFMDAVTAMGGMPEEILQHRELLEYVIPILRADFRVYESYVPSNSSRLSIPIDVFYGDQEGISEEDINAWKVQSTEAVNIRKMKGNHFFIFEYADYFSEYFRNQAIYASLTGTTYS